MTQTLETTRDVPRGALVFAGGDVTLGDNGEDAKTAPIAMLARTGQPIEHWFWGRVVHDMDGMSMHKARLPVDFDHDEVIGFLNKFSTTDKDGSRNLRVSGALVPFGDDVARSVIHKHHAGVPYEASINFGGDGIVIEEVDVGFATPVNGYMFEGPGVVFRKWPLRGVAVTAYGADMNTVSEFSQSEKLTVSVIAKERTMAEKSAEAEAVAEAVEADEEPKDVEAPVEDEAVDTDPDDAAKAKADAEAVDAADDAVEKPDEDPVEPELLSDKTGQEFLDAFGDQGGVWFAQGKTWSEATLLFVNGLKVLNEELTAKLAQLQGDRGEVDPVSFPTDDKPAAQGPVEFFADIRKNAKPM